MQPCDIPESHCTIHRLLQCKDTKVGMLALASKWNRHQQGNIALLIPYLIGYFRVALVVT